MERRSAMRMGESEAIGSEGRGDAGPGRKGRDEKKMKKK
jgi:hypothetical protein